MQCNFRSGASFWLRNRALEPHGMKPALRRIRLRPALGLDPQARGGAVQQPTRSRESVSPPTARSGALHRIVVGSDFSELGDRALLEGVRLCSLYSKSALHVI